MVAHLATDLARGARQLVFPGVCLACGRLAAGGEAWFCAACREAITRDPHRTCPRCSSSVGEFAEVERGCPRCRGESYHFDAVSRLGPYEGTLRDAILRLKFGGDETLASAVGMVWSAHAEARFHEAKPQVVVPVPLHWRRRWWRGYNQAETLAEQVAERLRLPCRPGWLRRVRSTPPQTNQSPTARRENLRGAFRASRAAELKGLTVLLIDDVLTTGSTASEAARALKEAGAGRVVVAVLAHR